MPNSDRPTLYLHAGYPKTGTTSLQQFCAGNAPHLQAQGLLYPQTGRLNGAHYAFNFSLGIGAYNTAEYAIPSPAQLRASLIREVAASGCRRVLISSEYFITCPDPARIAAFFQDFHVQPVICLRRHDHALASSYAQSVKTTQDPPWPVGITPFALFQLCQSDAPMDYLATLRAWDAAFGPGSLILRPVEAGRYPDGLTAALLAAMGVAELSACVTTPAANTALPADILHALDLVQHSQGHPAIKQWLIASLIHAGAARPAAAPPLLPPANAYAVVTKFQADYAAIARQFLGRADGVLFGEAMPDPRAPWAPPQDPPAQDVVQLLITALSLAQEAAPR